jgi:hypothetical protein
MENKMMYSLNSNIDVDGKRYHVQTEKLGWQIVTLVFEGGAVIARHKKDLSEVGAVEMSPDEFATLMKEQHQAVINEIHTHTKTVAENNGQPKSVVDSLDDVVYGPSTLPETPPKKVHGNSETTKNDDLISRFLNEWADEEEPEKK